MEKKIKGIEKAVALLGNRVEQERIGFTTYQENGKKYLAIFGITNTGIGWSKHFVVESIADGKGINENVIDNKVLFQNPIGL